MNWGTRIFISFVIFMGIIISMVVISMRQDVSLVASDYYKQELAYQDQIDKQQNALASKGAMTVKYNASEKQFLLSSINKAAGEIHFYRPSDASQDMKIAFEVNEKSIKTVSTKGLESGLWKVKLSWKQGEKPFYLEKTLVL